MLAPCYIEQESITTARHQINKSSVEEIEKALNNTLNEVKNTNKDVYETLIKNSSLSSIFKGVDNRKVQELIGHDFEDYLTKNIGGEGSFSKGGRDFDGGIGNRWWEAKSGGYWDLIINNPKKLELFKSSMGDRLKIAKNNGATYELITNSPIPEEIKAWLTKKGIPYTEILD